MAAARSGLAFEEQQCASLDGCPADCTSVGTRHHSRSCPYSVIARYSQRRPSCRRQTRPRTRGPVTDNLGMITVHRCQDSAAAGRRLRSSGGSIAENMVSFHPVSLAAACAVARSPNMRGHCLQRFRHSTGRACPATTRYRPPGGEQSNSIVKPDAGAEVKSGTAGGALGDSGQLDSTANARRTPSLFNSAERRKPRVGWTRPICGGRNIKKPPASQ